MILNKNGEDSSNKNNVQKAYKNFYEIDEIICIIQKVGLASTKMALVSMPRETNLPLSGKSSFNRTSDTKLLRYLDNRLLQWYDDFTLSYGRCGTFLGQPS